MLRFKFLWHILGLISHCFVSVAPAPDVTSICGPETNQTLAQQIQASQWLASDWLQDQRKPDWGWDFLSTGSAILSLQLANETWTEELDSPDSQLTLKQLEIEMLHELSHRANFKEMSIGHLAYYVMALHATCHDVTDFYGHNIVRQLHNRVENFNSSETNNYFPFSLAVLALCSSGNEVPHAAITTLDDAQNDDGCFPFGVDVTSMAVMAMSCMQPTFNSAPRLETLRRMIRKGTRCIMDHQRDDGGFGSSDRTNIISTGLAAQALIAADASPSRWQCEDAMGIILDAQHADGHFGSHGGTIQILPVLSNRHHGSLVDIGQECPEVLLESIPAIGRRDDTITVTIEVIQENVLTMFNPFDVDALPGESLFRVMERARQIGYLEFESKMTQFGNFINNINNVANDNANSFYWFIYNVDENGDQVSSQTGPDGINPVHGSTYRWIYREYVSH